MRFPITLITTLLLAPLAGSTAFAQQISGQQRWTNDEGKTITADFVRIEGTNVVRKLADGRETPIRLRP